MMDRRAPLTPRQQQIFDYIAERIRTGGFAPSIREIGAHLSIRSTNGVADHLKALKRKGYLDQVASKSRTWRPLPPVEPAERSRAGARRFAAAADASRCRSVPLLGRVAGGAPRLAREEVEEHLQLDASLMPSGGEVFALRVVGRSMRDAGIDEDDIVFVRRGQVAPTGSIVVALIDDEATVKFYLPRRNKVILRPANPAFTDIVVEASAARELRLLGQVVGVYRRL